MASAANQGHVKPTSVAVLERLMASSAGFAESKFLFLIPALSWTTVHVRANDLKGCAFAASVFFDIIVMS
jgi:hypothetical protein